MADLSYLFQGSAPPAVTTTTASSNGLPDWYAEYLRGIAGKATSVAGANASSPLPSTEVAGFTPDQIQAFQKVRDNVGSWQPGVGAGMNVAQGVMPGVSGLVNQGQSAVSGPAASWTDDGTASKYMSPYTTSVVNEIARLGNQNFNEVLAPKINDTMIGSGQFGSERNADVLARAARDNNQNIMGQQSNALQQGYAQAQTQFNADASRAQQQQQMQGSAALQGASTLGTVGNANAGQLGALGQATSALGLTDAQALEATGQTQQSLNQAGLDASYTNAMNARQDPWNTLNNMNSIVRGVALPQTAVQTTNAPANNYSPGALQQVGATYGWMRGSGS